MRKTDIEQLMKNKGFSLNVYDLGIIVWEFEVKENNELKEKLCKIFGVNVEKPETVILQCRENFSNCIFFYDCNIIDMKAEDFIECIKQMDDFVPKEQIQIVDNKELESKIQEICDSLEKKVEEIYHSIDKNMKDWNNECHSTKAIRSINNAIHELQSIQVELENNIEENEKEDYEME